MASESPAVRSLTFAAATAAAALVVALVVVGAACERKPRPARGGNAPTPPTASTVRPTTAPQTWQHSGDTTMGGSRPDQVRVREAAGPAAHSDAPFTTFTDVTADAGLQSFRLHAGVEAPKNWIVESVGGGLVAADFDGDGDIDLFLIDGDGMSLEGEVVHIEGAGSRLYRNDGGFTFTDVTKGSGLDVPGYAQGGAAADYDGDGDIDVCVVGYDMLHLFRNRGDATFEDVTASAGIVPAKWTFGTGCAWGDIDGDGRLDLYVSNYVDQRFLVEGTRTNSPGNPRTCIWRSHPVFCGPRGTRALPNNLYLQRADGAFADVSATHLVETPRASFQPIMTDLDGDGDLDIYVPNDGIENTVLENDGKGHLTDRGVESGASTDMAFEVQGSMGVDAADFDFDGKIDVMVTNFAYEYNALWRNRTRPNSRFLFEDVSIASRFSRSPQPRVCWGTGLVDFDGDGLLDCYVAAGHVYREDESDDRSVVKYKQTNQILRCLGAPKFLWEDVTDRAGPHFKDARLWRGAVFPDLDDDGDPDVVAVAQHDAPAVLRNDRTGPNAWLRFDLRGLRGTPAGARVTVETPDGTKRMHELHCGSSFGASDDPRLLFGLGPCDVVPRVEIRWPGGAVTKLENVRTRQTLVVKQEK
ncbi:MAG: CRTAC1 family protein [Planctomycetes bacterium]|nr:CRTAC1 family protein [Planctomycetota bacterium]